MIHRVSHFTILALSIIALFSCASRPEAPSRTPVETEESSPEPAEESRDSRQKERDSQERERRESGESEESERVERSEGAGRNSGGAFLRELRTPPETAPERRVEQQVERIMRAMSPEERIGQLIFPAIMKDSAGRPISRVTEDVRSLLREVEPGGILLFGPNFTTVEETRAFLSELQGLSEIPLVFAVDQEGGVVSRLTESSSLPATPIPPAATVGAAGSEDLARELGRVVGAELRSLGIVMNLAPVADVNTNPSNPVIRERAYGEDPRRVGRIVAAVVEGMQSEGVAAVLKHFPGHGDTYDDTHHGSATVYHDLQRLRDVEFVPFRSGIEAGARGVMTGHITVPEVLGSEEPATFSPEFLGGLLREELGFDGLVVTDSLSMAALINYYAQDEIVYRALEAGNDILLRPLYARRAYEALLDGVASGRLSQERIDESVRRILQFKFDMGLMELPSDGEQLFARGNLGGEAERVLGRRQHREVVRRIREAAEE
ncbi:MAG: glycoside hydrolase family 3 protein [Spirochaetaceae bacterium]